MWNGLFTDFDDLVDPILDIARQGRRYRVGEVVDTERFCYILIIHELGMSSIAMRVLLE